MSSDDTTIGIGGPKRIRENIGIAAIIGALATGFGGVLSSRDVASKLEVLNFSLIRLEGRMESYDRSANKMDVSYSKHEERLLDLEREVTRLKVLFEQKPGGGK